MKKEITTDLGLLPLFHQRETLRLLGSLDVAGGKLEEEPAETEMKTLGSAGVAAAAVEDS